ncbi:MAG: hypothetical protein ABH827_05600 [bacterium]
MTNRNKIVLFASLALTLSIAQTQAQQLPSMDFIAQEEALNRPALTLAPAPTVTTPAQPTLALTPVKQEVSQNVEIIQNIEKIENSVEKIKALYSLMQQAAGQNFDQESQKAFAITLVNAFNDARTANAYIQQLLQAAAQTPLLNTEQQKYVAKTMLPLVTAKATPATTVTSPTIKTTAPVTTITQTAKAPIAKTAAKKTAAKKTVKKVVKKKTVKKLAAKKPAAKKPIAKKTAPKAIPVAK